MSGYKLPLVVIIIADENIQRVIGEGILEFTAKLRGKGLFRRQHQCGRCADWFTEPW
jgi:hypothetical protein